MDVAYDQVQEGSYPGHETPRRNEDRTDNNSSQTAGPDLGKEFQDAYKAVQASPWGAKLGGWFGQVRKQGESLYSEAQKEATAASEQATKGFTSLQQQLAQRTRGMSLNAEPGAETKVPGEEAIPNITTTPASTTTGESSSNNQSSPERPESLPADILKEATSLVGSFRNTAAAKLKDLQRAEDKADEALLAFGSNVRNFLRDAVVITSPDDDKTDSASSELLFETREAGTGKKVFHNSRLEAQLHAIHTTAKSFTEDPAEGEQWKKWREAFDVEKKTEDVARDLNKFDELRGAMEKLVPEKVEYKDFWTRYYFLRSAVEEDEKRRKEVLKATTIQAPDEEVAWDESDDEETDRKDASTPNAAQSTTTLNAPADKDLLKPKSPRRSNEENTSVADSEGSYDVVSGATSRTPSSPKESKKSSAGDDSDDDWE